MIAQVKRNLASPCWEVANSSWICLAMLLVIGTLARGVSSSPPSWEAFDLKSRGSSFSSCSKSPTKRVRSQTLKVALTSYSHGNSSLYALLLILWSTLKGPSPWKLSLYFLCFGNLSLLKWSQTLFPSSKITFVLLLLFLLLYLSVWYCIWDFTFSCIFFTNSDPFLMNKIANLGEVWGLKEWEGWRHIQHQMERFWWSYEPPYYRQTQCGKGTHPKTYDFLSN